MNASIPVGNFGFRPEHVVDIFLQGFDGQGVPTLAELQQDVEALLVGPFQSLRPSSPEIVQEILRRIDVRIGAASILEDSTDHEAWLESVNQEQWRLWPRLRDFLRVKEQLPRDVLAELDRSTNQTLDRLESPNRSGRWDRRGLVVGHVQSGKTTHYTSLAAKAIDAGYRIVIVLAGMHNSLRSQTHDRIDRHLIGRDSCALDGGGGVNRLLGVGEYARQLGMPEVPFSILTCTNSSENGDFKDKMARQVWFQVNEGARLVMVVKKNATILRKLRDWLRMLLAEQNAAGIQELIHHPTLFIDDEADQASINTRDADQDPSAINGLIRELMKSFSRVGLVGYTATPFANIFIDPSAKQGQDRFGPDLFPRSFIVSLKAPDNYVGPAIVFGHPGDDSVGISPQDPLPMYIPVNDSAPWVPSPHRTDHFPGPLPESLREAIRVFVLACAARAARGDDRTHNSMLIHATRFIAVQSRIAEQVDREMSSLRTLLSHGSPATVAELQEQLRLLWQKIFVDPHPVFMERLKANCSELPSWNDIWRHIVAAADKINVMKINGSSDDSLVYSRTTNGLSVIAIGGDKLSRGLTLEGLSVSFFLRTSSMFDTLMQMGRWFGYRPRYADLCRVYTTADLYGSFREIALAIDDLRADLDRMALANRTPEYFGLRVRTPSDGLLITAANKLRRGETVQVRFAGELEQALQIPATGTSSQMNRDALERLVGRLPTPLQVVREKSTSHFVWHDRPVSDVLDFLTSYEAYRTQCFINRCEQLRRYISDRTEHGQLKRWTICLVNGSMDTVKISGLNVALVRRARDEDKGLPLHLYDMRQVAGREEEAIDLSPEQFERALSDTTQEERKVGKGEFPSRKSIRKNRNPDSGLLLLYPIKNPSASKEEFLVSVCVSFPEDKDAPELSYTVNDIWRNEYGFIDDWEENGQSV